MKQLSSAALDVLASGLQFTGSNASIVRQLDRKLYVEVNAALEALGGAWNRKVKAHVFVDDPRDALDQVLVDGAFSDKKRDLNQFFTPAPLAKEIVELADVYGHDVLEPSAGYGALALEALAQGARRVVTYEADPKCREVLRRANSLRRPFSLGLLCPHEPCDFLQAVERERFARVVMNPPFTRGQDVEHVLKAFGLLAPGGRLVAIMSGGVEFRSDKLTAAFRRFLADKRGTMTKLPPKSFRESGTDVNAVLVTVGA